jgi:hypothetical protein
MDMGLAACGRMKQDIYDDPYNFSDWDSTSNRCFVHLANSLVWRQVTGQEPPKIPATAKEYARAGFCGWYGKSTVTFSDVITRVRCWLWAEWVFETRGKHHAFAKLPHRFRIGIYTSLKIP